MFFKLVQKNSRRSRKENGLFYASLVISIIAFYIILSLEQQDVIIFLKGSESDAVSKLLAMIPLLYGMTLFILFFLVYFASKYQLDRRSHEFGVYLMLGMKRSRLFTMMLAEDIWSNFVSLVLGIPLAVALAELISLITARVAGLGIIGHSFSFSLKGAVWTAVGFIAVKSLALVILSKRVAGKEITGLLSQGQEEKEKRPGRVQGTVSFCAGLVLLLAAYIMAVLGMSWSHVLMMGITLILGLSGTFLLFKGISGLLGIVMKRNRSVEGLTIFTFRQLQENVLLQHRSQAVASLLVLAALCCFGVGIAMGSRASGQEGHVLDFTFKGERADIEQKLDEVQPQGCIDRLIEVRIGHVREGQNQNFDPGELVEQIEQFKASQDKDVLLNNLQYFDHPYLISLSGYNEILKAGGKEPIRLESGEAAMYSDFEFTGDARAAMIEEALSEGVTMELAGENYSILPTLYRDSFVVDRMITISYALIVPDEVFEQLVSEQSVSAYFDVVLDQTFVEERGLMQAVDEVSRQLKGLGLTFESYLQNMGRQLFYVVGASYLTIYLAVIFLIIANTVMGVQFLMQQRKTGNRYQILIRLGSSYEAMRRSGRKQIRWYFGLPVGVAVISSFFGLWALFTGLLPSGLKDQLFMMFGVGLAVIALLCVIECIYVLAVMRLSDKHILELMRMKKQEL